MRHNAGYNRRIGLSCALGSEATCKEAVVKERAKSVSGCRVERPGYRGRSGRGHDLPENFLGRDDLDLKDADSFDVPFDLVPRFQKHRRHAGETDARGSARADHIARLQGDAGGKIFDDRSNIEDHVAGIAVLHDLAVDAADQADLLRIGEGALVNDPRPHRAEGIERLSFEPLTMLALQLASGHIQADGVAEYIVVGFVFGNITAFFADDPRQLDFPVELRGDFVVYDFAHLTDYGGCRLGEIDRPFRILDFQFPRPP